MRQSISPYRKFPNSKSLFILLALSSLSCLTLSCTSTIELPPSLGGSMTFKYGKKSADGTFKTILKTSSSSCFKGIPTKWNMFFSSNYGDHKVALDYSEKENSKLALVNIAEFSSYLDINLPVSLKEAQQICENNLETAQIEISEKTNLQPITSVLDKVAPDCNFEIKDRALFCSQKTISKRTALREVKKLKKKLLRKWSRHPYLLARKLSIGFQIAKAVQGKSDEQLNRVCSVIRSSLKAELPFAISMDRWKNTACNEALDTDRRRSVVLAGLKDVIKEQEFLLESFHKNSRKGLISVRIPRSQNPAKDYWVSLEPTELNVDKDEKQLHESLETIVGCWHPLYSSNPKHLLQAKRLHISSTKNSKCVSNLTHLELQKLSDKSDIYIRESIASETEFAITNGRSKIIRLPKGDYRYAIRQNSGPFSEEFYLPKKKITASGSIKWTKRRPHVVIRNLSEESGSSEKI